MYSVKKRDGSIIDFNLNKIETAIEKAFKAVKYQTSKDIIELLALRVTAQFTPKIVNDIISVEDIPFTLDYDIKIEAQKKQITGAETDYNFSAQYVIDQVNSISDVNDPYLKIRKTPNGYLILQFSAPAFRNRA